MAKWQAVIEKLWVIGAIIIDTTDDILDESAEILRIGGERLLDLAGLLVVGFDWIADRVAWGITYFGIHFLRRVHDVRVSLMKYRRPIQNGALYFIVSGLVIAFLFSHYINYSYSYNGRTMGIVREQKDVLDVLDLVSEELTQEYGLKVAIDGDTDITFKPVLSFKKEIDKPDNVLKKFTYMGDIQTKAFGFFVNGIRIGTVQSEEVGNSVVQAIISKYIKGNAGNYDFIGVNENVRITEENTSLTQINSKESLIKIIEAGTVNEYRTTDANGNETVVKEEVPIMTVKTIGEETFTEPIKYETQTVESDQYYEGDEFVQTSGSDGKRAVTARVTRVNGEVTESEEIKSEVIIKPITKVIIKGTRERPPTQGTGTFMLPVNGGVDTSSFGWRWGRMHEGIDIGASTGTPIMASDGGTVITAGWNGGYGLCVDIDHGGGVMTRYGHCSSIYVSVGEKVFQGQTIAAVGSTGWSTGPHCHFEIRIDGVAYNPLDFL
ncbi:MAG: peptidoglycan DD-metalloendopeptidase family protein [Firmicutes bacterium]|nr:peptidoglycan DD-metalloendopeptidase family protein [Bacillota bacterium]